jgi:hypothetical protein
MENHVPRLKELFKQWRFKKSNLQSDSSATVALNRRDASAPRPLPQQQQVLFDYYQSLPTETALYPNRLKIEDTMMANTETNFKEILWETMVGHDILSVCRWDNEGLKLRCRNNLANPIEGQKRFITLVYFAVKRLWFDFIPFIYATNLKKRLADITDTVEKLDAIEKAIGITPKPRKDSVIKTKKFIKTRVAHIFKALDFKTVTDLPLWRIEKKQAEQAAIKMLHDCFAVHCPSCDAADIYHNIAKITLLFGTSQHYKNDLTLTELEKETARVQGIHQKMLS